MNIYFYTFGCKVNQYETENIAENFNKIGYTQVAEIALAQVCVINTCTVTAQSDTKCRQLIHRIRKENPTCVLVMAGCLPQAFEQKAIDMTECDVIVGTKNKTLIPELVEQFISTGERVIQINTHEIGDKFEHMSNTHVEAKTRAYIKIQDGCDMFCTYCIIPKARGHICSKPLDEIKKETQVLVGNGHKEIILTGINICCYGRDFKNNTCLIDAIEAVCSVDGEFRVRLGSIEPEMISDEDIARMVKLDKLCPQFHLSLQSGCDTTLKAMNRHYDTSEYSLLCKKLRTAFPACAITTDIMVGFPQESEEDFAKSLAYVQEIAFADAHIFPYSRRSGTAADKMNGQIDKKTKQARAKQMADVTLKTQQEYLSQLIGSVQSVLFEKENSPQFHQGHCRNYVLIKVKRTDVNKSLRHKIWQVKITGFESNYCIGEMIYD